MFNRLILTGAGIKGLAYLGAIKRLEETGKVIDSYIGVSIGAMVCLGLVLGYNSDELVEIFSKIQLSDKHMSILNLFKNYGVHNCNDIMGIVTKAIKGKGLSADITFAELYKITNKDLIIVVTNLSKQRPEYLSYKTEPDMKILSAMRLTINIPFFFDAVKYKGDFYIDGATSDNYPVTPINHKTQELLDKNPSEIKTLIVSVKDSKSATSNINSLGEYLYNIIKLVSTPRGAKLFGKNIEERVIHIPVDICITDFNLSSEKRKELYQLGLKITFTT